MATLFGADIGTGATIGFGTSTGFTPEVTNIAWSGGERPKIQLSHMGSTGTHVYKVGELSDPGTVTVEINFDPSDLATTKIYTQASETITVTFPLNSGGVSAATMAFTGAVNNYDFSVPLEDRISGSFEIAVLSDITWTAQTDA